MLQKYGSVFRLIDLDFNIVYTRFVKNVLYQKIRVYFNCIYETIIINSCQCVCSTNIYNFFYVSLSFPELFFLFFRKKKLT